MQQQSDHDLHTKAPQTVRVINRHGIKSVCSEIHPTLKPQTDPDRVLKPA